MGPTIKLQKSMSSVTQHLRQIQASLHSNSRDNVTTAPSASFYMLRFLLHGENSWTVLRRLFSNNLQECAHSNLCSRKWVEVQFLRYLDKKKMRKLCAATLLVTEIVRKSNLSSSKRHETPCLKASAIYFQIIRTRKSRKCVANLTAVVTWKSWVIGMLHLPRVVRKPRWKNNDNYLETQSLFRLSMYISDHVRRTLVHISWLAPHWKFDLGLWSTWPKCRSF